MTEAEWLTCTDPQKMLEFLRGKVSDRKLRLFAVACCRRIWHLLTDERSRNAVEAAERFADGLETGGELGKAFLAADSFAVSVLKVAERSVSEKASYALFHAAAAGSQAAGLVSLKAAIDSAHFTALAPAGNTPSDAPGDPEIASECTAQTALLQEIFGNPLRSVAVDPSWLKPGVVELARTIYEGRSFDRLPVLADALEEAGCHDADILAHCREPGPHVRGCFVLDLLLQKS